MIPQTLFDKVWQQHLVEAETDETPALLYVDLHLIHELTSPRAFDTLRKRGLSVRRPGRTVATMDHGISTSPGRGAREGKSISAEARKQLNALRQNCRDFGIELLDLGDERQGIVHVIGPEQGFSLPGETIVCGDSHTSTHGAMGALAFGIGSTEVGHVLATQCLLQRKPGNMAVVMEGEPHRGVTAKDMILHTINRVGVHGAQGFVIEYRGSAIRSMAIEQRLTVCNMSIEMGARAGMIAPDDTTYSYLEGRPRAPRGKEWERRLEQWQNLASDAGAEYGESCRIDISQISPMVTYGTNPGMVIGINQRIPELPAEKNATLERALSYMGLEPGSKLLGLAVEIVFIGSCTNARLSDLRAAASIMSGRRVANHVRTLIVPGSQAVKREAEREGLDRIFTDAGAEWRASGCSMCVAINQDRAAPGQYVLSTSNRNFEGRQGRGARTLLASPLTAAATAIAGVVSDPREFLT